MKRNKISELSTILGGVNFLLLLFLLIKGAPDGSPQPMSSVVGHSVPTAVEQQELDEATKKARVLLSDNDFSAAFDMVLVASRIAPSDPSVFELVTGFVEQAASNEDDEVIAMAEDLLGRGDSLVYYQSPSSVGSARQKLEQLRQSFFTNGGEIETPGPLEGVRQLLAIAKDATIPTTIRSKAAEQARSLLNDTRLQSALSSTKDDGVDFASIYSEIDSAERQCIVDLFAELKPRVDGWKEGATAMEGQANKVSAKKTSNVSRQLGELSDQGFYLLQELMPYSKSGIKEAQAESKAVEKQVKQLQRQKNWLYNKQVLTLIREIETKKDDNGWSQMDKIRQLAVIREEKLSPYIIRRYNELWEKVFEELTNEDEKVNAVRLRILKIKE